MVVDYRLAFDAAPVGLVISRNRIMIDCNRQLCEMFHASREVLIGQTFQVLYPSVDEYERLGARIAGDADAYRYLAESIRMHPDQETLKGMMTDAGFEAVEYFNLSAGVVAVHRGWAP